MCGIAGFFPNHSNDSEHVIRAMTDAILKRGPDDEGRWVDSSADIVFGHRRLSILDLSPLGHQPMTSASGRFVIVFNGEVYNFAALASELSARGYTFKGGSDTEVMLAAFEEWGVEPAVQRFVGMFAFGLWDHKESELYLVRDRLGVKPLYYGWSERAFLFGSELKALKAHPGFSFEIDRDAVALLMYHNYVPAPYSIYRGIFKLPAAAVLKLGKQDLFRKPASFSPHPWSREKVRPSLYWSAAEVFERAAENPFNGSVEEAERRLEEILDEAVKLRMIADVPLGAFLSGGIDSSIVVAMMQKNSTRPVRTFSIGFHEDEYNEAKFAKEVARHIGTDHTELYVSPREAMDVIPLLPAIYDEPFSDSSQIPTYLVSKLARQHVTVSLSGDGGDELFAGYSRYLWATRAWRYLEASPTPLKSLASGAIRCLSPVAWERLFKTIAPILPHSMRLKNPGDKLHKFAAVLKVRRPEDLYYRLISHWTDTDRIVPGSKLPGTNVTTPEAWPRKAEFLQLMMYMDMVSYLPDDILVKVDRASMAVSLEAREPLLDHRLVEFVCSLPPHMKLNNGVTKWILRRILYKYVPQSLIDRPKMGFGVPIDHWLRGPMREWAESLLEPKLLESQGFFDSGRVRQKWSEHLEGRKNWQHHLWDVLMFQAWYAHNA